ncbi:MAG: AsmA family protein [Terriglobales bacterium]
MRKLAITFLILLMLGIAGALLLPYLLDVNSYRGRIQAELEQRLHRPVTLGAMELKVLPLAFRVENVAIAEDPAFGPRKNFAEADELYVTAALWPLLHGQLEVQSLELNRPRIELVRNTEGVWNYSSLGRAPAAPASTFSLAELKITDGAVAITDLQKNSPRTVYDHIDLTLGDYAPGKAFSIVAATHLAGAGAQTIRLEGRGGPVADEGLLATPFDGDLELQEVSLAGLAQLLQSQALAGSNGVLTGKAAIQNSGGRLASKGTLRLEQARIRGVETGFPIALEYDLSEERATQVFHVEHTKLTLGRTPIAVQETIGAQPTPAQLDLNLTTPRVSIQEAARLAAAFGVAFSPSATIAGNLQARMNVKGAANRPTYDGTIAADSLVITGKDLPRPVEIKTLNLELTPAAIRSSEFSATTAGTTVTAQFALADYAGAAPTLDATVRTANAGVSELLDIAKAYGVSAAAGVSGSGTASLNVRVTGPLKGSWSYSGSGALGNALLNLPSLRHPLRVRHADLRFNQNSVAAENLDGALGQTNATGSLTLRDFSAPSFDANVRIPNAGLGELLDLAKAYGVAAAEGVSGSGAASLNVHASGPLKGSWTYSGSGALGNASLSLPSLRQPLKVRRADLRFTQNSVVLENLDGSLGQTNATGNLTLRDFNTPQVSFTLAADKIVAAEWQQMMVGGAQPARAQSRSFWSVVPEASAAAPSGSLLSHMSGSGTLRAETILYDQLVFTNARAQVALDHGLIRLAPITADLYGGQHSGAIEIDARVTPVLYTVNSKLDRVDANKLLSSVSSVKETLYGLLLANADTRFTASSAASSSDIARTLNGKLNLNLRNGKLTRMDLLYELASIGKFLFFGQRMRSFTNMVAMTGDFDVNNGVARTDNLKATLDVGTMAATGSVNLADQTLNLRLIAVLNKAFSDEVGGTGVGGYLTTALSNSKGELVVPVIISGTFQKPRFAPDFQKIAQMKLENLAPTLANPGELTSILGSILGGKKKTEGGEQQPEKPGLGDILGTLGGKKKPEQNPPAGGTQPEPGASTAPAQPSSPQPQQPANPLEQILTEVLKPKQKKKEPPPPPPPQKEEEKPPDQPK